MATEDFLRETEEMETEKREVGKVRAFKANELSDAQMKGIVSFVNQSADEYFTSEEYNWYKGRTTKLHYWINQEVPHNQKGTDFGFVKNYMRAGYDYYKDSFVDIYDVDDR